MHLLIVGLNYAPENVGVGKYTAELAEWLAARGHRVTVVAAPPHYPEWRIAEGYDARRYSREFLNGVEVLRCPIWMPRRLSAAKRILACISFALSSVFPLVARGRRADVLMVVEPTFFAAPAVALLGALTRRPTWLHVQDFELAAALGSGYLRRGGWMPRWMEAIEDWMLRRFDCVSTLGAQMDRRLAQACVLQARRAILPNWVDCAVISPLDRQSVFRARLKLPTDTVVALYAGTFGRKHGLDLLVEVARSLRNHRRLHFVFCGEGTERTALQAAARDLSNITWLPLQPIEELNELLNLADLHLLPQLAEVASAVLPSKLTGMLASGRPVVATAEPETELAECVAHAGLTVAGRDVQAFAQAVVLLADDSDRRRRLGAAARLYALQHFDKRAILERYETTIRRLMDPESASIRPQA